MNKDLLNQLPADEQPIASKLDSLAEDMQLSPAFQAELETQLMDTYKTKTQPARRWQAKIIPSLGWALLVFAAVFVLNWTVRSVAAPQPSAPVETTVPELTFADQVRQGDICASPLALAHSFKVFITNDDKTGFMEIDQENTLGEARSFDWSPDGEQLAIFGNTTGHGNIYFTDQAGRQVDSLSGLETGYLRGAAWSRDGKQIVMWSSQNNQILYVLNAEGNDLVERQLEVHILGTPQFAPDGESIIFHGSDVTSAGLFEVKLGDGQVSLINPLVEDESGFAFSPDGSRLAYVEMDRETGQARVIAEEIASRNETVLGTLPIPQGSGSSIPEAANLSWSPDGTFLVFDFGQFASQRAIYLAHADGSGLIQIIESGYAPTISSDGRCLAYISNKQVFLLNLVEVPSTAAPVLLADLPAGRNTPDLDKLQWQPGKIP